MEVHNADLNNDNDDLPSTLRSRMGQIEQSMNIFCQLYHHSILYFGVST